MTRETYVTSTTTTAARLRTRWAAIGAAVAVTLGAGTIATVDAVQSSGERLTYVASEPCRLMNTRPGTNQVGPRTTPLPEGTPITVQARGAQGNCNALQLPADAVALQLNVTPVNATAPTDITIWPAGAIPQASSLNPRPGPPVPNAVVATLHTDGTFQMQNKFGTIDMVIDVLGYFVDHNHDDRYYTEAEVDDRLDDQKMISLQTARDYSGDKSENRRGPINFTSSLVLPPDYTPGTTMRVNVHYFRQDFTPTVCTVTVGDNFNYAFRPTLDTLVPGQATDLNDDGGSAAQGLDFVTTGTLNFGMDTFEVRTLRFTLDSPGSGDLQPGDVMNFGLNQTGNTCAAGSVGTFAAELYYD